MVAKFIKMAYGEAGGRVTVYADCSGMIQKFVFTPV